MVVKISTESLVPAFLNFKEIVPCDSTDDMTTKALTTDAEPNKSADDPESADVANADSADITDAYLESDLGSLSSDSSEDGDDVAEEHFATETLDDVDDEIFGEYALETSNPPISLDTSTPSATPSTEQANSPKTREVTVKVPCWVREHAVSKDRSDINFAEFEKCRSECWFSIAENRRSGLYLPDTEYVKHGQPEEWLAGGFILRSSINSIWPYDGRKIHKFRGKKVITSKNSEDWQFDWDNTIWRSRIETKRTEKALEQADQKMKRKVDELQANSPETTCKIPKTGHGFNIIRPYLNFRSNVSRPSTDSA